MIGGAPRRVTADVKHGRADRSSLPQHAGRRGHRDRRARVHVRGRIGSVRSPACVPRHGRCERDHLSLLLDAVPLRSLARAACGTPGGMCAGGRDDRVTARIDATETGAVASSRTVIIAGAGIGGLTAALAIARHGFDVTIFDQAQRLEEIGAGIQLSPNASRILIALGLGEQLRRHVVAPEELRVMNARTARVLARAPLGAIAEKRYGTPYWVIHRGDLQAVLIDAVRVHPDIVLHLGTRVEDFALDEDGVTIAARSPQRRLEERGVALVAADGLWSNLRQRLGHR